MKAVVAAFNQEKALVGAFSVITNLRMDLCLNLYTLAASQHTTARVRTHYRNVKYEGQTYLLVLSHFEIKLTISFRILKHSMRARCTNNKQHTSDEVYNDEVYNGTAVGQFSHEKESSKCFRLLLTSDLPRRVR